MITLLTNNAVAEAVDTAKTTTLGNVDLPAVADAANKAATELPDTLWEMFLAGGWLMWVLLLLGGITIFIFVERFVAIRRAQRLDMHFMNRIRDFVMEGKVKEAIAFCRYEDTPIARMVEKGLERLGRPMGDVQNAIENVANLEVSKLENGLPFLATIAGGAPMIGFLGTVFGMVSTFGTMAAKAGAAGKSIPTPEKADASPGRAG